jgi:hypothetical protein
MTRKSIKYRSFQVFMRQDKQRVDEVYEKKMFEIINMQVYEVMEKELDAGFGKVCGMKGSKLSGG